MYLGPSDFVRVGYGWEPDNSTAVMAKYGSEHSELYETPGKLFFEGNKFFIEYDAESLESLERGGFSLEINVLNMTGTIHVFLAF